MTTHTPGPWEVVESFASTGEYVKVIGGIDGDADDDGRPRMTSTHVCDVIDNQDEQPNARLIAAAPDLLAALERVIEGTEDTPAASDSALAQVRAAIAKATGAAP